MNLDLKLISDVRTSDRVSRDDQGKRRKDKVSESKPRSLSKENGGLQRHVTININKQVGKLERVGS